VSTVDKARDREGVSHSVDWTNWSGILKFSPSQIVRPADENEVVAAIDRAAVKGVTIRPVGAGHSSMPLVRTDDVLLSLDRVQGVESHDAVGCTVTARGGTRLEDLTAELLNRGLSLENIGDVDFQTLAGVVATGTHGTGIAWGSLAAPVTGMRLVTGEGKVVEWSTEAEPELMRAARISLGLLGISTSVTLRVLPAFRVHEQRLCMPIEACLARLTEFMTQHAYFDFYWYPRRDEAGLRLRNPTALEPGDVEGSQTERVGWMRDILPHNRELKFNEMEYAVPRDAGPECFRAVRERIRERHLQEVGWRVLYRTVAAEDAYLSPSYGRDSVTISVHHNAHLPFEAYFSDIEPIFQSFDGRPHWAKLHTLKRQQLQELYPMWETFSDIRRHYDPDGRFLNDYLRELFE
jgi:FAD/FMN-containing dehydrogenase